MNKTEYQNGARNCAKNSPIAFNSTNDMHDWLRDTVIHGKCSVVDNWTYGLILVEGNGSLGFTRWSMVADSD